MNNTYGIGIDMDDGSGDYCSVAIFCSNCQFIIFTDSKEHEEDLSIPVMRNCPNCGVRFDGFKGIMEYNA